MQSTSASGVVGLLTISCNEFPLWFPLRPLVSADIFLLERDFERDFERCPVKNMGKIERFCYSILGRLSILPDRVISLSAFPHRHESRIDTFSFGLRVIACKCNGRGECEKNIACWKFHRY